MDHREQHHQHHLKEREEEKRQHHAHDVEQEKKPLHRGWLFGIGAVVTLIAILLWTLLS